jgi:hypothetical protein
MSSLTTTCLGVSNGSAALAITRAFRANRDRCLPGAAPLRGTDPFSARSSSSQAKRTVKIGVGLPATLHLNCFSVAEASAGSDASRCLPPLSAHRYSVVSHANAGRADEQPTTPLQEGVVKLHLCSEVGSCPIQALLPQEDRKALGALVVLSPSLSFANSEFTFANNLRLNKSAPSGDISVNADEARAAIGSADVFFGE